MVQNWFMEIGSLYLEVTLGVHVAIPFSITISNAAWSSCCHTIQHYYFKCRLKFMLPYLFTCASLNNIRNSNAE